MKKSLKEKMSLDDSEIFGYSRINDVLVVQIQLWNEKTLDMSFLDVIGFMDANLGDISDIIEQEPSSNFSKEVFQRNFDNHAGVDAYFEYVFLDLDDYPSLRVIARSYTVSEKDS